MEDAIRQRIKYLVEHGELYPTEKPLERAIAVRLMGAMVVLQLVDVVVTILK
jgi:hypothetical protein